jgi:hypothetical protein
VADLTTMLVGFVGAAMIGFQQKSAAPIVAEVVKDVPTVVEIVANATATANTVVH